MMTTIQSGIARLDGNRRALTSGNSRGCAGGGFACLERMKLKHCRPLKQAPKDKPKTFADYKADARNWITPATGEYYPDILKDACELYKPVLVLFGQLLRSSESSTRLFLQIAEQSDGWMRVQL